MLYDIVLGGVLGATFIPVFIERLATKTEREAWRSISSVVTVAVVVLFVTTGVFFLLAPWLIDGFTAFTHSSTHNPTQVALQRQVATTLLRWFTPQIFLYGILSLGGVLLNIRRRFGAPMWVPIANNVVCIIVLLIFAGVAPNPTLTSVSLSPGQLALLGAGTTAGVAVQALLLLPSLAKAKLGRLRWRFNLRDEALHAIVRLGSWTFGFVVLNQVALYVVLALAYGSGGSGPVSAYTYAYAFMQMPYAIVAVSVMSAVTPDLADHHTREQVEKFIARFGTGLRAVLAIIIPSSMALFVLARPFIALLLGHGQADAVQTHQTGTVLSELSLGLVGFTVFQYVIRALQSMRETKTAFWLYLAENALTVGLAVALVHPLGLAGVALSVSLAYTAAAVAGLFLLRHWLGRLGPTNCFHPLTRICTATVVMGVVLVVVSNVSGASSGPGLLVRVVSSVLAGGLTYLGVISFLGRRKARRRPSLAE